MVRTRLVTLNTVVVLTYLTKINFYQLEKNNFCQVYGNNIPDGIPTETWYTIIIFWNTPM